MASTLTRTLMDWIPPSAARDAAAALDESEPAVARALSGATGSILGALAAHAADPRITRRVFDLAGRADVGTDLFGSVARQLGPPEPGSGVVDVASDFLGILFGERPDAVAEAIGRQSGIRAASARSLLRFAAPLMLAFLRRQIRERQLDAASLGRLLLSQRHDLARAAPGPVAAMLGLAPDARESVRQAIAQPQAPQPVPAASPRRWLWPTLITAALVALLLWPLLRRDPVVDVPAATERVAAEVTAAGSSMVDHALPGGLTISVPERGVERPLIDYIESNEPLDSDRWFGLDRVRFEVGSARLDPGEQALMDNFAAILRAYPSVHVEIGGFADSSGDATANMTLSQNRADAVRNALIARDISPDRIVASGYGSDVPFGSNVTDAGRAENRTALARITRR